MRAAADAMPDDSAQVDRLTTVLLTFAERALRRPRLAWALIAEPVDPLVDAERLAYRERYSALTAQALRAGIEAGELPAQNVELTAAALVGGCGEALVGPLSPLAAAQALARGDPGGAGDVRAAGGGRARHERRGPGRARRSGVHGAAVASGAAQCGRRCDGGGSGRRVSGVRRGCRTPPSRSCTARAACSAPAPI